MQRWFQRLLKPHYLLPQPAITIYLFQCQSPKLWRACHTHFTLGNAPCWRAPCAHTALFQALPETLALLLNLGNHLALLHLLQSDLSLSVQILCVLLHAARCLLSPRGPVPASISSLFQSHFITFCLQHLRIDQTVSCYRIPPPFCPLIPPST